MTRVISLINQKGGVGKSTCAINIGAALNEAGKRVLLIDNDPQSCLTRSMGTDEDDQVEATLLNIFECYLQEDRDCEKPGERMQLEPTAPIIQYFRGMDYIPCELGTAMLEVRLHALPGKEGILKRYIDTIKDRYDYILIDCAPSLGIMSLNALTASDSMIIPIQPGKYSTDGLNQLMGIVRQVRCVANPELFIEGILISMIDGRVGCQKRIVEDVREKWGKYMFNVMIPDNAKINEASASCRTIIEHFPKGPGAQAYREVVKEIFAHEKAREKAKREAMKRYE